MMTFTGGGTAGLMRMGFLGQIAGPLVYIPDLLPVGSGSAYFPRSVEGDAQALNFLGFLSDADEAIRRASEGSQGADMGDEAGAWDTNFRSAITRFQASKGLTVDSWVGPQTRTALAAAVAAKNAGTPIPPPPPPGVLPPIPVNPGTVPALPAVLPGVTPAPSSASGDSTTTFVAVGAGVLILGGLAWYALT